MKEHDIKMLFAKLKLKIRIIKHLDIKKDKIKILEHLNRTVEIFSELKNKKL